MRAQSIAKDFPALQQEEQSAHASPVVAYLDNAATTHKPSAVLRAVESFYKECNANPYRGAYRTSVEATKLYECSRLITADFIGAKAHEVIFTRNTTESLNIVAAQYAREILSEGDHIVLPVSEHHSNLVIWQQVAQKTGAKLVYLMPDSQGRLTEEELSCKIGPQTKVVAVAHISNVLGMVNPVASIVQHARAHGALVVLDCAQSVAHMPLDVKELDVDFAAFSGHKMYAPMGIGVLYGKEELLERMEPLFYGGEMIEVVREHTASFEAGPKRFEAGTPNVAGALGLAAAIHYLSTLGFDTVAELERALTEYTLKGLQDIEAVRIYGGSSFSTDRAGVISFNYEGVNPQDLALLLDAAGVAVRSGTHCTQPLHRRLGIEASCRVSPCLYNTQEEIDSFLACVSTARRSISRRIMASFP